jgi:hypothetical protein
VLFGYSPELVKEILQASSVEKQPDEEKQKLSRAEMGFENQESIQNPLIFVYEFHRVCF